MISRVTLGSLLVALLIPSGLALWSSAHRDSCSRYLAGDRSVPATQLIQAGDRMIEVSCDQWFPRQRIGIQAIALMEVLVVLVFGIHAAGDVRDGVRRRRIQREKGFR